MRAPPVPTSFFFNATAPTDIYTLSLHDALPIYGDALNPPEEHDPLAGADADAAVVLRRNAWLATRGFAAAQDRKSTRLNSSHMSISYAVFCLKKKKKKSSDRFPH